MIPIWEFVIGLCIYRGGFLECVDDGVAIILIIKKRKREFNDEGVALILCNSNRA